MAAIARNVVQTTVSTKKCPTGIAGFDAIANGGLMRGRANVVVGGAGSGKTVFALQSLVNAARVHGENSIFVSFEEPVANILANHEGFRWNLRKLAGRQIHLLAVQLPSDVVTTGDFDLLGLLAAIDALVRKTHATRIVFDAIDVLLSYLRDPVAAERELGRLHEWVLKSHLSTIITAKSTAPNNGVAPWSEVISFMVDCTVVLHHRLEDRACPRGIQIVKYRGSPHADSEYPLVITANGIEIQAYGLGDLHHKISNRRVSTGIKRLDHMLGGGYYEGSSILVSGAPGTAKSTLAGAFVGAACADGRRALYVSFDEAPEQIVRNLRSVSISLGPYVARNRLRFAAFRMGAASVEENFFRLTEQIEKFRPDAMVVDPLSALVRADTGMAANAIAQRLIDFVKAKGITVLCTSLTDHAAAVEELSTAEVSTIVDTWIQLSYAVRGGERNRALTIIKSRGMGHSNQVRELVLSAQGITLTDIYTASGEVLMGSARAERESADFRTAAEQLVAHRARRLRLVLEAADTQARLTALQLDVKDKLDAIKALDGADVARWHAIDLDQVEVRRRRGADIGSLADPPTPKLRALNGRAGKRGGGSARS